MPVLRVVNLVMVDLMIFKNCNAMKKIFTRIMLWAVAATALASCANNDINDAINDNNLIEVTLTADKTAVRTELIDGVPYWSKGDAVGAYFADEEGTYRNYKFTNTAEVASLTASFTGQTEVANTLYVYYPYTANGAAEKGAKVDIPANQEPTATSFDGKADIMLAKPITLDATGTTLENLQFARLGAIVKVVLNDGTSSLAGQHISTFSMTAATNLVGRVYVDVVNQELGELYHGQSKTVNAKYTEPLAVGSDIYLVVYPQTLAAGSTLKFEASTEGYAITKTATLKEDIALESGKLTTLKVSLAAANVVKEEAGLALPFEDDFSWVTTTNSTAYADTSKLPKRDGADMYSAVANVYPETGKVKFGSSSKVGSLTTSALNLSQPFTVIVGAYGYDSDELTMKVMVGDVAKTVTLTTSEAYYGVEFEAATKKSTVTIECTQGGKRFFLSDLKVVAGHDVVLPTLPPVLTVSKSEISVSHEKATETFTYSVANPVEGTNVAISDNADWISTTVSGTTVTVTVAENTAEEARKGAITVTYGDLTKQVAVSQDGKPAEGGPTTVTDVLDRNFTGINDGAGYGNWSNKKGTSNAVYAGNSAGSNNSIQLRSDVSSTKPASGVVTTTSGGKVSKIKVTWNTATAAGRTLNVFGSNTAYTGPADLADTNKQGTKLGTIVKGTSTELTIAGDYKYIGFRSNSGAMYMEKVEITWVTGDSDSGDDSGDTGGDDSGDDSGNTGGAGEPTTVTMTSFSATSANMDSVISYSCAKGGGTSAPAINSNQIRLYQNSSGQPGGNITITAKEGYTITSVVIGSSMSTSVAYQVNGGNRSSNASLAANGKYTINQEGKSITIHCMGSSSSTRLYVNHLSVTYK